jgi:hypothetical protein
VVNFSDDGRIEGPAFIRPENNTKFVNISAAITTVGAVARISGDTNTNTLVTGATPELLAAHYGQFIDWVGWASKEYGIGADGAYSSTAPVPAFLPQPTIKLGYTGTAATVDSKNAIASATIIVASYDSATKRLLSVEKFENQAITAGVQLSKTLTVAVPGSASYVKVFLWDNLTTSRTPLVASKLIR